MTLRAVHHHGISVAPDPLLSARSDDRNCDRLKCSAPWSDDTEGAIRIPRRLAVGSVE
jgi:hypothetical protein